MAVQADDVVPPWPVEETATSAYTAGYGEVLGYYDEAAKASGNTVRQEITEKLTFYNQVIGRTAGVLDVAGKAYAGKTDEAVVSAGLAVLGELAGTEAGKAILAGAGLTTAPVTAAIFAIQVGMASQKAVEDSTNALQLVTLYALVEGDPVLKDRSRELGVGDPILVTPESVEHVWKKVYLNSQWQAAFKTYVVTELEREWPEQGYWDQMMLPAGNAVDQAALLDRASEYKPYIAGLLSHLNNLARSREQFVVASRYLAQIQQTLGQLSSNKAFDLYIAALGKRPEVVKFIAEANIDLAKPQSSDALLALATKAKYYGQSMELLPTEGKIGTERKQLLTDLKRIYDTAWSLRNKQASEAVSKVLAEVSASLPPAVPRPSRYEGVPAQEYMTVAKQEFEKSKTLTPFTPMNAAPYNSSFRAYSPAASALVDRERAAIRAYYQRQIDQFNSRNPTESEANAFGKAARTLESVDLQQMSDAYNAAAEHITSFYLTHYHDADQVMTDIYQLESEVPALKKRSDKIYDIVSGYCQGAGLTMPGYVGITSSFRIPPVDPLAEPANVSSKLTSYLYSQQLALLPYSVVSICADKSSMQGTTALSALPSAALLLLGASEVDSAVALLQVQVETVQERVEAIKWYDEKRMDYFRQKVVLLITMTHEAREGLKDADGTRSQIQAFIPKLQTQLSNIENDREYLVRLQRIANFLPVYYGARDLHGQSVQITPRYFMMRPGISNDCVNNVGLQPLMSAADFEAMWKSFDRRMADARVTWLSEQYNLGLTAYLKEQFKKEIGRATPAGDYIFLGTTSFCGYYEPARLESMAAALDAIPGNSQFLQSLAKTISYDDFRIIFGVNSDFGGNYDFASLTKASDAAAKSRSLGQSYWNTPARDALAKLVKAYDAAIARYVDYQNKEADYAELLAKISPLYGAFTSSDFDARQLYDKNIADPAALALYRKAEGEGKAALGAYKGASTNAKISVVRQEQLAKQADDIALRLHFVTAMIANMESQIRGRAEGAKAVARAEKITTFYSQFKAAYERKDASRLMAMLAGDWKASDGTRPSDVEAYFRNMFNVFDEIRFDIGEVQVDSMDGDRIQVSYSVSIKGIIFSIDTEHEEKSSVTEVVSSPDSGSVRILQTLQGRFWYP